MKKYIFRISILNSIVISYVIGAIGFAAFELINLICTIRENSATEGIEIILASFILGAFVAAFLVYPIVLAIYQVVMLFLEANKKMSKSGVGFDQIVIWYGIILEFLYITEIKYAKGSDWYVQLANLEKHTPVYTGAWLTMAAVF